MHETVLSRLDVIPLRLPNANHCLMSSNGQIESIYHEEPFVAIPSTVNFTDDGTLGIFLSGPSDYA